MAGNDDYTKLLIHSDTTDGSVTFTDSSLSSHTVTPSGDTHHETDQQKFGTTSIHFDGTGDILTIADHVDWTFGTGDFTIDFWFRAPTVLATQRLFGWTNSAGDSDSGIRGYIGSTGYLGITLAFDSNPVKYIAGVSLLQVDTWYHIALVRYGTGFVLYLGGNVENFETITDSDSIVDPAQGLAIGRSGDHDNYYFTGYIDEFRISKGIARWTTTFTPPTSAYTVPPSLLATTAVFALSNDVELNNFSTLVADFALGTVINARAYQGMITTDFVLGIDAEAFAVDNSITTDFVLNSIIDVFTPKNIIITEFVLGADLDAFSAKAIGIGCEFVLSNLATLTNDVVISNVGCDFALYTLVELDQIDGNEISATFVLGSSVDVYSENQNMTAEANFVLGSVIQVSREGVTCDFPTYGSSRWS